MEKIETQNSTEEAPKLSENFFKNAGVIVETALELERIAEADLKPEWQKYLDTWTDEELLVGQKADGEELDFSKLNRTAEDFKIDPETYPIFNRQETLVTMSESKRWNIDEILSRYLTFTADTIGAMDGHIESLPKTDEAIYLDKSARPVSKLVNALWDDFAVTDPETGEPVEKPSESFLNIDRIVWFRRVGITVDNNMYLKASDGRFRKATVADFEAAVDKGMLKNEDIAAIRALYIEIMKTPTRLDGKNITIIDEVSDTGATAKIAQILVQKAFPDAHVSTHIFSNFGSVLAGDGQSQMAGSPVWYPTDHSYEYGRGVLDRNDPYWKKVYEENPTPENYAKYQASFVLSQPMDLETEPGQPSKELFREIDQLAEDYHAGKVLFRAGTARNWSKDLDDRDYIAILRQGINPMNRNYLKICEEINARPPLKTFSAQFPPH